MSNNNNPELKRSKTDVSMNSNIVTLENLNDINENIFRKTNPKGKIFHGPNWTAFSKENLGSIPGSVEKALVEDKKGMTKIGFSTQTERFFPKVNSSIKNNPGPGTYNISGDMDFTRTSTSFYSSKGFGNGFTSNSERFNDSSLFYSAYAPGPGQYQPQEVGTIVNNVKKTLRAKSLYNNKKTQSLKVKKNTPGPGHYNPIMDTFDYKWKINKSKGLDSEFKSNVPKFFKLKEINYPGPGKYYKNENYIDYNDRNKPKTTSYFFKNPQKKKVDYLQKYDIKTKQNPEDLTFKLTDKKGGVIKNSLNCNIFSNPYMITKRDIYKLRNKTFLKENNKKDNFDVDNIYMGNNGLTNDQGIEYIEKILQKPKKADLMKLATPRWKLNELEFKVPGPAYYHPRDQPKILSFNRNNIDFIVTPGVFNEDDDNPIYDN
jgi:hypothetical protein